MFQNRKFFIFIAILSVIILIVMALSMGNMGRANPAEDGAGIIVTSLQKIVTGFKNSVSNFTSYFTEFENLQSENDGLAKRIEELEAENRELIKYREENNRLKELLEIKENGFEDSTFAVAEIISRDIGSWYSTFVIDKGTLSDVKENDPVVVNSGLVGIVTEVGTTWAKVSTILETNTTVGCIITRTRDIGVLEGSFELSDEGLCRLSYLPKTSTLIKGDTVETSGLGGIFPKSLVIGTVSEVSLESHGISKYAIITPSVDFDDLSTVFVITSFYGSGGEGS